MSYTLYISSIDALNHNMNMTSASMMGKPSGMIGNMTWMMGDYCQKMMQGSTTAMTGEI